jgi:N-acyl-D-aspartate/D-glutamate deacylase
MEGVEDIPGTALHEGVTWDWEDYPSYLQALSRRAYALDLAALIPHAPLRLYVMGERGLRNEDATENDLREMARLVAEGIKAGAVGFSTSRVLEHQAASGNVVPGTYASETELETIALAMQHAGHGVFQAVPAGAVGSHALAQSATLLLDEVALLARVA